VAHQEITLVAVLAVVAVLVVVVAGVDHLLVVHIM
jgi:preprotein translocase subunit SecE